MYTYVNLIFNVNIKLLQNYVTLTKFHLLYITHHSLYLNTHAHTHTLADLRFTGTLGHQNCEKKYSQLNIIVRRQPVYC